MTKKIKLLAGALTLAAVGGLSVAGIANAEGNSEAAAGHEHSQQREEASEAHMLASARISAADAARVASERTGLKVAEVELDDEAASPVWEVSVGTAADEQEVMIDAISGRVISVKADDADEAGEENDD